MAYSEAGNLRGALDPQHALPPGMNPARALRQYTEGLGSSFRWYQTVWASTSDDRATQQVISSASRQCGCGCCMDVQACWRALGCRRSRTAAARTSEPTADPVNARTHSDEANQRCCAACYAAQQRRACADVRPHSVPLQSVAGASYYLNGRPLRRLVNHCLQKKLGNFKAAESPWRADTTQVRTGQATPQLPSETLKLLRPTRRAVDTSAYRTSNTDVQILRIAPAGALCRRPAAPRPRYIVHV